MQSHHCSFFLVLSTNPGEHFLPNFRLLGMPTCEKISQKVYKPREPLKSPFFQLVSRHFTEFERVYPEKYQNTYGFWRPIIRRSIEKFIKCGDLREGFARVKCTSCNKELFVPFSCRQRCCCPFCHQKRVLLLAYHLGDDVIADVDHVSLYSPYQRGFVFTFVTAAIFWVS